MSSLGERKYAISMAAVVKDKKFELKMPSIKIFLGLHRSLRIFTITIAMMMLSGKPIRQQTKCVTNKMPLMSIGSFKLPSALRATSPRSALQLVINLIISIIISYWSWHWVKLITLSRRYEVAPLMTMLSCSYPCCFLLDLLLDAVRGEKAAAVC